MDGWRSAAGAGQRIAATTQLLYGALPVVTLVAMAFRPAWVTALLIAWGAALTMTGTLATVVWGGAGWPIGAVAGVSILAVVALIVWAWRAPRRGASSEPRGWAAEPRRDGARRVLLGRVADRLRGGRVASMAGRTARADVAAESAGTGG